MCLRTLHDRARGLGLGALYENHLRGDFRDLLDSGSAAWAATALPQKVISFKAFASAGVSPREIIDHYRETLTQAGDAAAIERLPATLRAYREAGYWLAFPDDLDAAIDGAASPAPPA